MTVYIEGYPDMYTIVMRKKKEERNDSNDVNNKPHTYIYKYV